MADYSSANYNDFPRGFGNELSPTWRDAIKNDKRQPPEILTNESSEFVGGGKLDPDRYTSYEFHRREVEKLWRRTWQPTCREEEIPNVGDHFVYNVANLSFLIVRTAPDAFKAYWNVCLHRGRQLVDEPGKGATKFRCGYHAWSWNIEGELIFYPGAWDFPDIKPETCSLREVKVGTWAGFVFINPDKNAIELSEHLGSLPQHFERWPLEKRRGLFHVRKTINANWKIAMEAFMESYHVMATHPELIEMSADHAAQLDYWDEGAAHFSRMMNPVGVPSQYFKGGTREHALAVTWAIANDIRHDALTGLPPEITDRSSLAEWRRKQLQEATGADHSSLSDAEILDGIEYWLFPNFLPWFGESFPILYIFRPNADRPDTCYMDVWLTSRVSDTEPRPEAPAIIELGPEDSFQAAVGTLGLVLDQDDFNMPKVQVGLHSWPGDPEGLTLARYQESRIRHFHKVLMGVLNGA